MRNLPCVFALLLVLRDQALSPRFCVCECLECLCNISFEPVTGPTAAQIKIMTVWKESVENKKIDFTIAPIDMLI